MKRMNLTNENMNHTLTSLEYAGLETLFQRIVNAYEGSQGIREEEQTPVSQITRRTGQGIEVFDGAYDIYRIEDFAVKEIYKEGDTCILAGFKMDGQDIEKCFDNDADTSIDITPFLDESYIDLEWLMEQLDKQKK